MRILALALLLSLGTTLFAQTTQNVKIDYNGVDQYNANQALQNYWYRTFELNNRFSNSNPAYNGTIRQAAALFDSIITYNGISGLIEWLPLASSQVRLDSFDVYFTHQQIAGNTDSLNFTVFNTNSFQVNGAGTSATIQNNNIWDFGITITTVNPLAASSTYISNLYPSGGTVQKLTVPVGVTLPAGQAFGIKVDFAGDTVNSHFKLLAGYKQNCATACGAITTSVGDNSYTYTNNGAMSGINNQFFDCNQNGTFGENTSCEKFFAQNLYITPHVTVNAGYGVAFPDDTFALCANNNTLNVNVFGATPPLSYQWSPPFGLSSTTSATPVVSIGAATTYSVTVTDANNNTASASAIVSPSPGLCDPIDTISGYVYRDTNNNGVMDVGENGLSNIYVVIDNNYQVITDVNGYYMYTLRHDQQPYQVSSEIYLPYFVTYTQTQPSGSGVYVINDTVLNYPNRNFGFNLPPDSNNAAVYAYSYSFPPRPGFNNSVAFNVYNYWGSTFSGTLTVTFDSLQTYINASPTPTIIDPVNHTITWNISALGQGAVAGFTATFNTPATTPLGTIVSYNAQLSAGVTSFNDVYLADNTFVLEQTVVGSYDPNDKAVNPIGTGPSGSIRPENKDLTYTIRFQNTGTFLAENVVIIDTLDTDLNINSFKMISSSHPCQVSINNRVVTFTFAGIMLPDSNSNEPASHGYVVYGIRSNDNITHLSNIENTAYIYFDFNAPIVTNTTSNLVDFYLSAQAIKNDAAELYTSPNPFGNELNVRITDTKIREYDLEITDMLGRAVQFVNNLKTSTYTFNTAELQRGVYLVYLKANGQKLAAGKIIKQ